MLFRLLGEPWGQSCIPVLRSDVILSAAKDLLLSAERFLVASLLGMTVSRRHDSQERGLRAETAATKNAS
jgi:hypothetical protein